MDKNQKILTAALKEVAELEQQFGENHPKMAIAYANLVEMNQKMGFLDGVLTYQHKVITIWEQILDKNDPSLAVSYNNLSNIYYSMGRFPEAL